MLTLATHRLQQPTPRKHPSGPSIAWQDDRKTSYDRPWAQQLRSSRPAPCVPQRPAPARQRTAVSRPPPRLRKPAKPGTHGEPPEYRRAPSCVLPPASEEPSMPTSPPRSPPHRVVVRPASPALALRVLRSAPSPPSTPKKLEPVGDLVETARSWPASPRKVEVIAAAKDFEGRFKRNDDAARNLLNALETSRQHVPDRTLTEFRKSHIA
eukprot:294399-Prymnesium_polylepis.1